MATITKLNMKNFKSFKKASIPINKGFSAVVGPNGSGKSNILDALLFVTGITSTKLLRAGKLTDLIYSNSREEYCSVELLLSHKGEKYCVKRIVDKKGHSIFMLNDKKKAMNEVTSFLREIGIKSDGHNFAVQGDITAIVEKTPIQRRQLIDDLAGLSEFDSKKEEAQKELEKVEKKINNVNIALKEREEASQRLEKEWQDAKKYLELEKTILNSKATILWLDKDYHQKQLSKNTFQEQEQENSFTALETEISQNKEVLEDMENEYETKTQQAFSDKNEGFSEILTLLEEKKATYSLADEKLSIAEHSLESIDSRIKGLKEKEENLKQQKKELEVSLKEKKERQIENKSVIANLEKKSKKDMTSIGEKKFSQLKSEIEFLRNQVSTLKEEKIKIEMDLENSNEKNEEFEYLTKQHKELSEGKNTLEDLKKEVKTLESEIERSKIEEQLESTHEELHLIKAEITEVKKSLKNLHDTEKNCPVCTRDLPEHVKNSLLKEKHDLEKELDEKINKIENKLTSLKQEKEELNQKKEKLNELNAKLNRMQGSLEDYERINKKLSGIKKIDTTNLNSKLNDLVSDLDDKQEKLDKLEKEFDILSKQLENLESEKDLIETKAEIDYLKREIDRIESKEIPRIVEEIANGNQEIIRLNSEKKIKTENLNQLKEKFKSAQKEIQELEKRKEGQEKILEKEAKLREDLYSRLSKLREKRNTLETKQRRLIEMQQKTRILQERLKVKIEDLEEELSEMLGKHPEIKISKTANLDETRRIYTNSEKEIAKIGDVNLRAESSFKETFEELKEIREKINILGNEQQSVHELIEKIEFQRLEVFMECYKKIKSSFEEMFYSFFDGYGTLILEDEEKPLKSGLLIEANHKGTELKVIDALSGGEKTLTALAFLFALQQYNSAPFYVFDEADAALDQQNSIKLSRAVTEMSKNSQFILITHNPTLIKQADQVVGVTMAKDKSSIIGLKLEQELNNNSN